MLRTLVVSNFMDYRKTQMLKFQEGAHFLIGPNSSGKTALFELTRRCLSKKKNPKISYIPDESKPAYIICNFEMNKELAKTVNEISSSPQTNTFMYSCCFINKKQLFKLVCVYERPLKDDNVSLYIQRFPLEGSVIKSEGFCYEWESDSSKNPELAEQFVNLDKQIAADEGIEKAAADEGNEKTSVSDEGFESAIDYFSSLLNGLVEQERVKVEKIGIVEKILQQLDEVVVVTFPVRGHGPLQWNQNPEMGKIDAGYGKYRNASEGAVIINVLLKSDDVDTEEADKTFNELIRPNMFVFEKKKKQGNSNTSYSNSEQDKESEIVVKKQDQAVPLMKIPEGILEARHFSLLLAHKKYQTICLDEPGRGMHPPMVQRIRDLLLRKQKGKTLIVISHKPSMVNFWAFDRMFVSRNIVDDIKHKPYHSVRRVRSAMLRRYQEENLRKMLFSSTVLFIEGPTDRIVMGAIFEEILETSLKRVGKVEIQKLRRIVTEINMVDIEGSTGYNPYRALSHQLSVPYLFLFDKDSVFISKPRLQLKNLKTSQARFEIVNACLALADGKSIEKFFEKEVVTQMSTHQGQSKGKKRKVEPVTKVKDIISSTSPASTIRTIVEDMYLPVKEDCFCAKDNTAATFALREADDKNEMMTYSDRRVFIWETGNIEDVIMKSIIDVKEDDKMMKLFSDIVRCEKARPGKELLKEAILEIDQHKAKELSHHLLYCEEIEQFSDFMAKYIPSAI